MLFLVRGLGRPKSDFLGDVDRRSGRVIDTKGSIGTGFTSHTRRVLACLGLAAGIIVVAVVVLIDRRHTEFSAIERGRICACALTPESGGDLEAAAEGLRSSYSNLLAVAPLTPNGSLQRVFADDTRTVLMVRKFVKDGHGAARLVYHVDGVSVRAWAVTLPLNGDEETTSRRAVFVLRDESGNGFIRMLLACAVVCMLALIGVSGLLLTRWFDTHVVGSLRLLAATASGSRRTDAIANVERREPWDEWRLIAEGIQNSAQRARERESDFLQAGYEIKRQLRRKEAHLDHKLRRAQDDALVDPLTKLRNRRFLEQEFEPLVILQHGRGKNLSAVMIDLDNFKQLNDSCGHQAGDELLRFVGELLNASLRSEDHALRIGGDEFLLLLPDTDADEATQVVGRILRLFSQYTHLATGCGQVSMSAGVATLKSNAHGSGSALIADADRALYRAKNHGKAAVCGADAA